MPFKKNLKKSRMRSYRAPKLTMDDLINAESALGRTIFGPIPEGHQREFFVAQKNVWLYHENWVDDKGDFRETNIRYEVRPTGVYKKFNGENYKRLDGDELDNFCKAVKTYANLVKQKLYS